MNGYIRRDLIINKKNMELETNMTDKIRLKTILNNKLKLKKREEEIFEATYEYAFKMWVIKAWKYLINEWLAEDILNKE